jgi:hypothetical protein
MISQLLSDRRSVNWLIYTVAVALIPIIFRFLTWAFTTSTEIPPISIGDILLFSLIIHLSIINEISHINDENHSRWKDSNIGISTLWIVFITFMLTLSFLSEAKPDLIKVTVLLWCCIILAITNFIIGCRVYHNLSTLDNQSHTLGGNE